MNAAVIQALTMPKLGLTMKEGTVAVWHVAPGAIVAPGQRVFDVETEKVTSECEAQAAGVLRRQVVAQGAILPVGALVGVIADAEVSESAIDRFVADFQPEKQV